MSEHTMSDADIEQMTFMCRTLFASRSEEERARAKQSLRGFSIAAVNLQPFLSILPRSTDQYFLQFVTQSLRRIVTRHWRQLILPTDPIRICDIVLAYLQANGAVLPAYIISSFAHLLARVCKLSWNTVPEIRDICKRIAVLNNLSLSHSIIAYTLWKEIVEEMSNTSSNDLGAHVTDLSYAESRKACMNFSTESLLVIAQSCLEPIYLLYRGQIVEFYEQMNAHYRTTYPAQQQIVAVEPHSIKLLLSNCLQTFIKCLQFDFMGLNHELHLEDSTVIVIGNARHWRSTIENPDLFHALVFICRSCIGLQMQGYGYQVNPAVDQQIYYGNTGGVPKILLGEDESLASFALQLIGCLVCIRTNLYSSSHVKMCLFRNTSSLLTELASFLLCYDSDMEEYKFQAYPQITLQLSILLYKLRCNMTEYDLVNIWNSAFDTCYVLHLNTNVSCHYISQFSHFTGLYYTHYKANSGTGEGSGGAGTGNSHSHGHSRGNTTKPPEEMAQILRTVHTQPSEPVQFSNMLITMTTKQTNQPDLTRTPETDICMFFISIYLLTLAIIKCPDPSVRASPSLGYLLHVWAKMAASPPFFDISLETQNEHLTGIRELGELDTDPMFINNFLATGVRPLHDNTSHILGKKPTTAANFAEDRTALARMACQSRDVSALYIIDLILPTIFKEYVYCCISSVINEVHEYTGITTPLDPSKLTNLHVISAILQNTNQNTAITNKVVQLQKLANNDFEALDSILPDHILYEHISSLTAIGKFNLLAVTELLDVLAKVAVSHYISILTQTELLRGCSYTQPTTVYIKYNEVHSMDYHKPLCFLTHVTEVNNTSDLVQLPITSTINSPQCQGVLVYCVLTEIILSILNTFISAILCPELLPATRKVSVVNNVSHEEQQLFESVLCYYGWIISCCSFLRSGTLLDGQRLTQELLSAQIPILTSTTPTTQLFSTDGILSNITPTNVTLSFHTVINALLSNALHPTVLPGPVRSIMLDQSGLLFMRAFQQKYCGLAAMRVYRNNEREGQVLRATSYALGHILDSKSCIEVMICYITINTGYWSIRGDPTTLDSINQCMRVLTKQPGNYVVYGPQYGILDSYRKVAQRASMESSDMTEPVRILNDWLQLLLELCTGYTTVQSLASMNVVQWLLGLYTTHILTRTKLYAQRKIFVECLSRVVLRPSSDLNIQKELLYPLDIRYGTVAKQLSGHVFQPELRTLVLGLLADTVGIISACDSKVQYSTIYYWFTAKYLSIVVKICQACWNDNAIVEHVLMLIAELIDNRNGRATIEYTSCAPYVLLKEIASVLTAYALRVLHTKDKKPSRVGGGGSGGSGVDLDDDDDDDDDEDDGSSRVLDIFSGNTITISAAEMYSSRLKCTKLIFSTAHKLLRNYSSKLVTFRFHNDSSIDVCIGNLLLLLASFHPNDILQNTPISLSVFGFLECLTKFMPECIIAADEILFSKILLLLENGMDRYLSLSLNQSLSAVANSIGETFINLITLLIGLTEHTQVSAKDVLFHAAPKQPTDIELLITSQALPVFIDYHLRVLTHHPSPLHVDNNLPFGELLRVDALKPLSDISSRATELLPKYKKLLSYEKCNISIQNIFIRVAHHYIFDSEDFHGFASRVLFPIVHAFPNLWYNYNQLLIQNISQNALEAHNVSLEEAQNKITMEAKLIVSAASACFTNVEVDYDQLHVKPSWEILLGTSGGTSSATVSTGLHGTTVLRNYRNVILNLVSKPNT